MAGRSELPSGKPSSLRRTELRLGEPEPPAKKRIIDVAVLVEPCQLARVSGYRAMCAARWRPPASLVKVVLARYGRPSRAAFPVAGAKADAGLEWLPMASRQGSERSGNQSRTAQLAASFNRCREAHAAIPPGILRFRSAAFCPAFAADSQVGSLTQELFQRSVIGLRGAVKRAGVKKMKQNPQSHF